jgi:predicted PurR-regulated permease PerM
MTVQIKTRAHNGTQQGIFWGVISVLILVFLFMVRSVLLPFAVAVAVAYFFDPLVRRLQRAGLPRWSSAMLVLVLFIVVFAGGLIIVVPILEKQVMELIGDVPKLVTEIKTTLLPRVDTYLTQFGIMQAGGLSETASGYATTALSKAGVVLGSILTGGLAVLDLLSLLLVTPVVAFYLLRDWDAVVNDFDHWLPRPQAPTLRKLFGEIDRTLSGFIRGQALVCLIQATYYAVALTVAGLDFGALVGVATGVLTFIPYLGAVIGLLTGIAIAIAQWHDTPHVLIIIGCFAVGQILEGNFITPKLVGDRIGLHPVWVIFSVLAGGALCGFAGILLAVPVAAVIGVLIRFGVKSYLGSRFYKGDKAEDAVPGA